jgi:hypothetical protein
MPAYNEAMVGIQHDRIGQRLRAIEAQLASLTQELAALREALPAEGPAVASEQESLRVGES